MKRLQFKKLRLWASYPLYAWVIAYGYMHGFYFNPGGWFILAGVLVRLWAAGHICKRARLAVAGPYAFVRNPLYVGNFLVGLGFCLFCHHLGLVGIYIALFGFAYWGTVADEQKMLTERFGEDYRGYCRSVPAYFPRLTPYAKAAAEPYSLKLLIDNGELIRVFVTALAGMLIFFFEYSMRRNSLNAQAQTVFWTATGLCSILLIVVILHRRWLVHGHHP